jgi:hypothetical protein
MEYLKTGLEVIGSLGILCTAFGHALLLFPRTKPLSDRLLGAGADIAKIVKGAP